jgi:enoyl-CoA hydratase/carnithine racemase
MHYHDLPCFNIRLDQNVLFVNIHHPPMNLMNMDLLLALQDLGVRCESDDAVKVVVFASDDPDFFIAHGDLNSMVSREGSPQPKGTELSFVHSTIDRFRTMSKVTIAKVAGAARGGGSEFALAMDMRFGVIGKSVFGQPEALLGIIPGAGGTQRLPHLIGKARALEMILGCADIDAQRAEQYGYLNRALPDSEIDDFVNTLAYRIASLPAKVLSAAKETVLKHSEMDLVSGMIEEEYLSTQLLYSVAAQKRMQLFLDNDGQNRDQEKTFDIFNKIFDGIN